MIDHVRGACHINYPHLSGWMDRIMYFWNNLVQPSIKHILRSLNAQACLGWPSVSWAWCLVFDDICGRPYMLHSGFLHPGNMIWSFCFLPYPDMFHSFLFLAFSIFLSELVPRILSDYLLYPCFCSSWWWLYIWKIWFHMIARMLVV